MSTNRLSRVENLATAIWSARMDRQALSRTESESEISASVMIPSTALIERLFNRPRARLSECRWHSSTSSRTLGSLA
jgi:hypothetical protein